MNTFFFTASRSSRKGLWRLLLAVPAGAGALGAGPLEPFPPLPVVLLTWPDCKYSSLMSSIFETDISLHCLSSSDKIDKYSGSTCPSKHSLVQLQSAPTKSWKNGKLMEMVTWKYYHYKNINNFIFNYCIVLIWDHMFKHNYIIGKTRNTEKRRWKSIDEMMSGVFHKVKGYCDGHRTILLHLFLLLIISIIYQIESTLINDSDIQAVNNKQKNKQTNNQPK